MTMQGLCLFLDVDEQTIANYGSKEGYEDYFGIVARIKAVIRDQKFSGAAAGLLNANIIARDLGLAETSKNEHTGAEGGPIKTETTQIVFKPVGRDNDSDSN
jgi:hypothetical protein